MCYISSPVNLPHLQTQSMGHFFSGEFSFTNRNPGISLLLCFRNPHSFNCNRKLLGGIIQLDYFWVLSTQSDSLYNEDITYSDSAFWSIKTRIVYSESGSPSAQAQVFYITYLITVTGDMRNWTSDLRQAKKISTDPCTVPWNKDGPFACPSSFQPLRIKSFIFRSFFFICIEFSLDFVPLSIYKALVYRLWKLIFICIQRALGLWTGPSSRSILSPNISLFLHNRHMLIKLWIWASPFWILQWERGFLKTLRALARQLNTPLPWF